MTPAERREAAQRRYNAECASAERQRREAVAAAEHRCTERYERAEAALRQALALVDEEEARDA